MLNSLTPPSTPKRKRLSTRDEHIAVTTLRNVEHSFEETIELLEKQDIKYTVNQVRYAETHRLTSQKQRCEFKVFSNTSKRQRVIQFVIANRRERHMSYIQVDAKLELLVFERNIPKALQKRL